MIAFNGHEGLDIEQVLGEGGLVAQGYAGFEVRPEQVRMAVAVQEARIAELSLERSLLVLRSPMDGVVCEVLRSVGETITLGEPILTVAVSQPSDVIAYATATGRSRVDVGMEVELELARGGGPRVMAKSRVIGIGPTVEQLPMRLWQNPAVPEWGWPIGIAAPPAMKMLSGESVGVRGP